MSVTKHAAQYAKNRVRTPNNLHPTHGPLISKNLHGGMKSPPPPPPPHPLHGSPGRTYHLQYPGSHPGAQGGPHMPGFHHGPIPRDPLPQFPGQNGAQGGPHGWQGLGGIMQMLQQGITPDQLANLGKGYTGGNGYAVGNAHDAFSGLSPYAAHWLATSGVLQQAAPHLQDLTGLSGDALWQAQQMNSLAQAGQANSPYTLHSGMTQDILGQMLGMTQGGGFAKGYNATGRLNPMNGQPFQQ